MQVHLFARFDASFFAAAILADDDVLVAGDGNNTVIGSRGKDSITCGSGGTNVACGDACSYTAANGQPITLLSTATDQGGISGMRPIQSARLIERGY